jgi:hypothetical protein
MRKSIIGLLLLGFMLVVGNAFADQCRTCHDVGKPHSHDVNHLGDQHEGNWSNEMVDFTKKAALPDGYITLTKQMPLVGELSTGFRADKVKGFFKNRGVSTMEPCFTKAIGYPYQYNTPADLKVDLSLPSSDMENLYSPESEVPDSYSGFSLVTSAKSSNC